MGSRPVTCLWLWPATDHEPHCRHVPINEIWRWTESTPRRGSQRSHMAGIYSACGTREIIITEGGLWYRWNRFRTLCDSSRKIGVVLELTADLPSELEVERWTSEPVKALVVPTSIFLTNKKGFPVLSRAHQNVIRRFLKVRSQVGFAVDRLDW